MTPGEQSRTGEQNVRIAPFAGSDQDLAALTQVRNETLKAASLPEDFRAFAPRDMYEYYSQGGYSLEGNAWLLFDEGKPVAAAILYPPAAFQDRPPGNFHLYVVPSDSRRGYGSHLLDFLGQEAANSRVSCSRNYYRGGGCKLYEVPLRSRFLGCGAYSPSRAREQR